MIMGRTVHVEYVANQTNRQGASRDPTICDASLATSHSDTQVLTKLCAFGCYRQCSQYEEKRVEVTH